jgi:hypothetical protein
MLRRAGRAVLRPPAPFGIQAFAPPKLGGSIPIAAISSLKVAPHTQL